MNRLLTAACLLGMTVAAAGCGGGDTKTVTVGAPPAATTPAGTEPATTTAVPPTETLPPLPGGRAALEGRYEMRLRDSSFEGENVVLAEDFGDGVWPMSTECDGDTCTVTVRRELQSGAFKTEILDEVEDRTYAIRSEGQLKCPFPTKEYPAKQRLSLRASGIEEVNGRPTAVRVDAYLTSRSRCGKERLTTGTWSWRGSLER